jgi:uncharacterized membrane protein
MGAILTLVLMPILAIVGVVLNYLAIKNYSDETKNKMYLIFSIVVIVIMGLAGAVLPLMI